MSSVSLETSSAWRNFRMGVKAQRTWDGHSHYFQRFLEFEKLEPEVLVERAQDRKWFEQQARDFLWSRPGQRVRFVTDSNPDISKVEAATIFPRLAFEMHTGNLKDWLLIIEEGDRFGQDPGLRALLIEARKLTRKLILVTADWRL